MLRGPQVQPNLFRRLLLVQRRTSGERRVGVDRAVARFDQTYHSLFVDDNVSPQRPLVGFVLDIVTLQDAVRGEHLVVHVAEERETDIGLLCEGGIGSRTIHANAEHCCI
jgi:hypothetical protein